MKFRLCATLAVSLLLGFAVTAADGGLLAKRSWFLSNGATSAKQADGSLVITQKQGGTVLVPDSYVPVTPGKSYRIRWIVEAPKGIKFYPVTHTPPRTPWPSGARKRGTGAAVTVDQILTIRPGESKIRPQLAFSGSAGSVTIREHSVTEISAEELKAGSRIDEELIPQKSWIVTGGASCAKQEDDSLVITKKPGEAVLFPDSYCAVEQGRNYRIRWIVEAPQGINFHPVTHTPPRTPWPSGALKSGTGKPVTLDQYLTIRTGESRIRPQLALSGDAGKLTVKGLRLTELSAEELKAETAKKMVRARSFSGKELQESWTVFGALRIYPGSTPEFEGNVRSGLSCTNLEWPAAEVKAIEVQGAFQQSGNIRLDFTADDNGTKRTGYLTDSGLASGVAETLRFSTEKFPSWRGTIREIRISWCSEKSGRVRFDRIAALKSDNLIPFAGDKKDFRKLHLRPRGEYLLKNASGAELRFLDRHNRPVASVKAGSAAFRFTVPELAVVTTLTGAPAGAELLLESLKPLELPVPFWRGKWIWCQTGFGPNNSNVWFERTIDLDGTPSAAEAVLTGDDNCELFINGKSAGVGKLWNNSVRFDIRSLVRPGRNRIVARVYNEGAWGGFLGECYFRVNGKDHFLVSDSRWLTQVGGNAIPEKFAGHALEIGAPPAPPWGANMDYLYVGPKGELELTASGRDSFTVKVKEAPSVAVDSLRFELTAPDGKKSFIQGGVQPGTGSWKAGENVTVRVRLPRNTAGSLKLATDFLRVAGDPVLFRAELSNKGAPPISTAKIVNAGKRAYIQVNGENYAPIYYDFFHKPDEAWRVRDAVAGGCRIMRFTIGLDTIWPKPGAPDLSQLDRFFDTIDLNAPDMKVIVQLKLAMPHWWCDANPDDLTRYDRDQPISVYQDRQALGSKKWIADASPVIREVIRHIRKSYYADKVIGMGIAEGWNCEWFWTVSDRFGQPARSGFSIGDYATMRSYLRERYKTDAALAAAWHEPETTLEDFVMPSMKEQDKASCMELLDPVKDRKLIDWFIFRNRSLGEAIEAFGKVVKEETQNKWLVGVYYGYFTMMSSIYNRLQSVGHLDVERLARSPYVDIFWAPSSYRLRRPGLSDGIMQVPEALTSHNKLIVVEQDIRTFCEPDHYESGRFTTVEQTVGGMDRAFGMLLARGIGTHWMSMHACWFREKVLLELIRSQLEVYAKLPEVKNLTPAEICIVTDEKSAFYTRHNNSDNLHLSTVYHLTSDFAQVGVPYRHVYLKDLLEKDRVPAQKLYIMTNLIRLEEPERKALLERLERERAHVLWLYAAGIDTENSGPDAAAMSRLLGIRFKRHDAVMRPMATLTPEAGGGQAVNHNASGPWFLPTAGFEQVLGRDADGKPLVVAWKRNGVQNCFSVIMNPPPRMIRALAKKAGCRIYSEGEDPLLVGNDVIFLHAKTGGEKTILLPPGCRASAIAGPLTGNFSGPRIRFRAEPGVTYGFLVSR